MNIYKTLGLSALVVLSLSSCGDKSDNTEPERCMIDKTWAPKWVCKGSDEDPDNFYAVGIAKVSAKGTSFQRKEAMVMARKKFAKLSDKNKVENSKQIKHWQHPKNDTVYILVEMPKMVSK